MIRQKRKSTIMSPFIKQTFYLVVLLLLVTVVAWPLSKKLMKGHEVNQEIVGLETETDDLNKKNSDLRQLINYLESDQFIDEQARKNLNFKKEGEKLVVINDPDLSIVKKEDDPLYRLAAKVKIKEENNFIRWFNYFFR